MRSTIVPIRPSPPVPTPTVDALTVDALTVDALAESLADVTHHLRTAIELADCALRFNDMKVEDCIAVNEAYHHALDVLERLGTPMPEPNSYRETYLLPAVRRMPQ